MFHLEDIPFHQKKKDFQNPFSSQILEQLFVCFNVGLTLIEHLANVARRKGNVNVNFTKNDNLMTLFKYL